MGGIVPATFNGDLRDSCLADLVFRLRAEYQQWDPTKLPPSCDEPARHEAGDDRSCSTRRGLKSHLRGRANAATRTAVPSTVVVVRKRVDLHRLPCVDATAALFSPKDTTLVVVGTPTSPLQARSPAQNDGLPEHEQSRRQRHPFFSTKKKKKKSTTKCLPPPPKRPSQVATAAMGASSSRVTTDELDEAREGNRGKNLADNTSESKRRQNRRRSDGNRLGH